MFVPGLRRGMAPLSPLFSPQAYFADRLDPLPSGLGVYGLYVLATAGFFYAVLQLFIAQIQDLPPDGQRALTHALPQVFGAIVGSFVVLSLVALLVTAAIMHYAIGGPESAGSFRDAVAVAGWAYAPDILALPVRYLLAWFDARAITLDGSDPAVLSAQIEAVQQPSGGMAFLVTVVVIAWSVYVLARGTAGTHEVDGSRTVLPALLIGLGALVLSLL